jgi:hypothetical protein
MHPGRFAWQLLFAMVALLGPALQPPLLLYLSYANTQQAWVSNKPMNKSLRWSMFSKS